MEAALDRPAAAADGVEVVRDGVEVVVVMGIPGAGKSRAVGPLAGDGWLRLNRDERGGTLRQLAADLDAALADGHRRLVLDNTYLTRAARSHVLDAARRHEARTGQPVAVHCRWLDTPLAQAQRNLVTRLLDRFGALPTPEELAAAARREPGLLSPTAQMRAHRQLEPPSPEEGFTSVEHVTFERSAPPVPGRPGLIVLADALDRPDGPAAVAAALADLPDPATAPVLLARWHPEPVDADPAAAIPAEPAGIPAEPTGIPAEPVGIPAEPVEPTGIPAEPATEGLARARARLEVLTGGTVEVAVCPHPGGPPVCWCRPPLPGLALAFARTHQVDLARSVVVGTGPAHRTMAAALGARVVLV